MTKEFEALCELLPGEVNWGDMLSPAIAAHIADVAIAKEREACATACLDMQNGWCSDDHIACAKAIRARSNEKSQATDAALSRQVACTDGLGAMRPGKEQQ